MSKAQELIDEEMAKIFGNDDTLDLAVNDKKGMGWK